MSRVTRILIAVAGWQLLCLILYRLLARPLEVAYSRLYTTYFGDVQASFAGYDRGGTFLFVLLVPLPATWLIVRLYRVWCRQLPNWWQTVVKVAAWQVLLLASFMCGYESGLAWQISEVGWEVFGVPEDFYGFNNLVLPRLAAWLVCSTPVAIAALLFVERFGRYRRLTNRSS